MNTGVIVVTHGDAGAAMIAAVEEKVAKIPILAAVGARVDEDASSLMTRIEAAVQTLGVDEIIFLVDLGGSTPFNLCCKSCGGHSVVVSGVNLAMLFKLSTADRTVGARHLAEELVATGTKSIALREGHT